MNLQLEGKKAIVTGGSRGLGKAITRQLALEGVDCAICARNREELLQVTEQISRETKRKIVPFVVDLRDAEAIQSFIDKTVQELGGLDILVNNGARVSGGIPEDVANVTDDLILMDFEEKFLGYFRCARAAVSHMRRSGWGRIINISGLAARTVGSISAGARNVAVVHLTKTLANELGKEGITVNAIYPALTRTESLEERLRIQSEFSGVPEDELLRQAEANNAIGRLVTAEEIAYVVTFIASPLSGGITGEVIAVTGGAGNFVYY